MIATVLLVLLQAPTTSQEDEAKRARDAVFGLPGFEQKAPPAPAEPSQEAPPSSFMTPRLQKSLDDYKALLDQNVFSPPRKKDPPKSDAPKSDGPKPPETKTKSWTVTGIVFNAVEKRYEALIEDSLTRESKYLKEGDTVAGAQLTSVTFDQVAYKKGETTGVLKLKEALTEVVSGGSNGAAAALKPEEQAEVDKVRERMKKRNRRDRVPDEAEEDGESRKKPK